MEARLRNLFSKRTTKNRSGRRLNLKAQPYESTVKSQSPIKGTRPIAGNGPYRLENTALQSQLPDSLNGPEAEAPDVPRERRNSYSYAGRPLTAPPRDYRPAQFEFYGRTRSGFSARAFSFTRGLARDSSLPRHYNAQATPHVRSVRSISAFSTTSQHSQYKAIHVDILDAAYYIKPSHETYIQRTIASGKRDYGEDVADRNIAEFGGVEFEPAYEYYDAASSADFIDNALDQSGEVVELHSRKELDTRDGLTWEHVSRGSDGTGDDTRPSSQQDKYSASQIYYTPPQSACSHARHESGNSDHSANGMRGLRWPGKSSSASTNAASVVIPSTRSSAITPVSGYPMRDDLNGSASVDNPIRGPSSRNQPVPKPQESWVSVFPPYPAVAPVTSPHQRASQQFIPKPEKASTEILFPPHPAVAPTTPHKPRRAQDQSEAYDPAPIPPSRFSKRTVLLTPPMSPTVGGSPTVSIPGSSLKELPPALTATKRDTRGRSTSYSAFPPQESGRTSKASVRAPTTSSEKSDSTIRPDEKTRGGRVIDDSSNPPPLEAVINTGKSTDTEVIKTHHPAVVHEDVTPKVHYIKEERIIRETHNHDVIHRVQPIIDATVLPTKHYVLAPSGNGLVETPESALPSQHTKWAIQPIDDKLVNSAPVSSGANIKTTTKHPDILGVREPLIQNRQKTVTDEGFTREETVWRHPPQLGNSARETGQTVPVHINHYSSTSESTDEYWDANSIRSRYAPSEQPSTNADGEEDLIFRDSDLAFDGRLPGLEDFNPAVAGSGTLPNMERHEKEDEGIGKATNVLIRRQAGLNKKTGILSVNEED